MSQPIDVARKARALDLLAALGSQEIEYIFDETWSIGDQIDDEQYFPSLVAAIEALAEAEEIKL